MQRVRHLVSHLRPNPITRTREFNSTIGQFGTHDLGANNDFIDQSLHRDVTSLTYWERKVDAFVLLLRKQDLFNVSELRHGIESIPKQSYLTIAYYEKWMYAATQCLLNKGVINENELITRYRNHPQMDKLKSINTSFQKYAVGDTVKVRNVCDAAIQYENWRLFLGLNEKSHVRAPGYIVNKSGIIESYLGLLPNDELRAFGIEDAEVPIYRVRFKQNDLFPSHKPVHNDDTIDVEIVAHWLQKEDVDDAEDDTDHLHDDDDHEHKQRDIVEKNAVDKEPNLSPYELLSDVVISLCCDKQLVTMSQIQDMIQTYDTAQQLNLAPQIVIKAWRDEKWKRKLMNASDNGNANDIISETFGVEHMKKDHAFVLKVVENDENTHNVICCTLCSCYPRPLLGLPPHWYKSLRYRSEIISQPRELLKKEFGCDIPENMVLRVHDSTSELRYIVLPHTSQIPNYKNMSDDQLAKIITRDMVIGVER
eukprot:170896_1